jgi:pyruvate formate lyase activating enzyme
VPVIWKTNGFLTPEAAAIAVTAVAAVNIDIKAADPQLHLKLTGAQLAPVLRTLETFRAHGVWVEVATPLIPGFSDQPDQLATIASTLASIDPAMPWHLLRFTPTFRMSGHDPASPDALVTAQRIGWDAGLAYVYVERALGADGRRTRCPSCSAPVVERSIWGTDAVYLSNGDCRWCGRRIDGVWE